MNNMKLHEKEAKNTTNKQTQQINVRQNYVGTPQDGLVLAVQKCLQTAQYSYIGELVTH